MSREAFIDQSPKSEKKQRGKTLPDATPVNVRTSNGVPINEQLHQHVLTRLGRQLGPFALRIERASVRFEDVNGPRKGVDIVCRIKVVLSGLPSVVAEERAASPAEAFDLCADVLQGVVRRTLDRSSDRAGKRSGASTVRRP